MTQKIAADTLGIDEDKVSKDLFIFKLLSDLEQYPTKEKIIEIEEIIDAHDTFNPLQVYGTNTMRAVTSQFWQKKIDTAVEQNDFRALETFATSAPVEHRKDIIEKFQTVVREVLKDSTRIVEVINMLKKVENIQLNALHLRAESLKKFYSVNKLL